MINKWFSNKYNLISIVATMGFLATWEIVSVFGIINDLYIGQPTKIFGEIFILLSATSFLEGLVSSLIALFVGYFIALTMGVIIGFAAGLDKKIYAIFRPFIFAINSTPFIVYLPLVIIWFGVDTNAKIMVVVLMAIIPVIINTIEGVRAANPDLIAMSKAFSTSKFFTLRRVIFREALPYIFSGSRIAFGRAFIAVIIAETFGFGKGLGYYISFYGLTLKANKLMAIILMILLINVTVLGIIKLLEQKYLFYMKGINEH